MEQIDVNLVYAGRTLGMSETNFGNRYIPTAGGNCVRNNPDICKKRWENMGRRLCWQEIYKERRGTIAQKIAMVIQTEIMLRQNLGFGCSSDRFVIIFL